VRENETTFENRAETGTYGDCMLMGRSVREQIG
jgi:hypothetical protein